MIVQAIGLLDDLDKELNTYAMRVREWYRLALPGARQDRLLTTCRRARRRAHGAPQPRRDPRLLRGVWLAHPGGAPGGRPAGSGGRVEHRPGGVLGLGDA